MNKPQKFRKKPVVIEAMQYDGSNMNDILAGLKMPEIGEDFTSDDLLIPTLEGEMRASPGDWIIKGISGEFYPCKPDIFAKTYDPAPTCATAVCEEAEKDSGGVAE